MPKQGNTSPQNHGNSYRTKLPDQDEGNAKFMEDFARQGRCLLTMRILLEGDIIKNRFNVLQTHKIETRYSSRRQKIRADSIFLSPTRARGHAHNCDERAHMMTRNRVGSHRVRRLHCQGFASISMLFVGQNFQTYAPPSPGRLKNVKRCKFDVPQTHALQSADRLKNAKR